MYRVIIVEDEPDTAKITKAAIEKAPDFQVKAIFSNGEEALNYIWLNPVDLILLDLFMPQMSGTEFLYRLRKEDIPVDVIVVTASSDVEQVRDVLPFGVIDYLLKPFSADRMVETLLKFDQRRRIINSTGRLNQSEIDAVFANRPASEEALVVALREKGLQKQLYDLLLERIRQETAITADLLAQALSLPKVTVQRYLNYMVEQHEIVSRIESGLGGRPAVFYRAALGKEELK